jgi:hypothetical protein
VSIIKQETTGTLLFGCTIGAKIFKQNEFFVVFKNKDFKREVFDDDLRIEQNLIGIRGVESWNAQDPERDRFSGLSIGMNGSLLVCADANIKSLSRSKNYDILVEKVLESATNTQQATNVLQGEVKKGYGWTNIVASDGENVTAFEVSKNVFEESNEKYLTRTNHYIKTPGYTINYSQNAGTKTRYNDSLEKLEQATDIEDIFGLLKTHRSMKLGTSICNHGTIHTVYSYVFEVSKKKNRTIRLYVCQGNPCKNEYERIDLRFPISEEKADEILERYPSRRVKRKLELRAF